MCSFFPLAPRADFDHFVDVNKMVWHGIFRDFAGCFGFRDDGQKISLLGISQQMLQIPSEPEFDTVLGLLGVCLESAGQCFNQFRFHRDVLDCALLMTGRISCASVRDWWPLKP